MKKIFEQINDNAPPFIMLAFIAGICWFIYKIAAGLYHLLDKLIDKL